ncbi:hypothetical protein [Hoeflea alexandrii]|uniref:hypothetical protein n=1 Tax=Hoeflea alexandrii TaxID=288436 RepID=UPI002F355AC9
MTRLDRLARSTQYLQDIGRTTEIRGARLKSLADARAHITRTGNSFELFWAICLFSSRSCVDLRKQSD